MTSLPLFRETVRPEWIDYNGHLSEAFYVLVFGHATDAMMDAAGMDASYRADSGCSLYTVESHIRHLRDVPEGAHLGVRTRIIGAGGKKAHFTHEMYVLDAADAAPDADDTVVATSELLALHVDQKAGRAVPFPEGVRNLLAPLVEPAPAWAGRSIARVV
ncbi:acyl-CoA thioester hydrolase [Streptomyces phaeochromogenes]|jgi:acyl-CoA thioester hydrolase|uniref:thioesterase family protein n=1 Tax=Streptomyces phaeochromogenes TaxID=1923 RepID=UPI0027935563|nr:thioesterase family protein [Streptomyces phaeochromogenes]MDQ0954071.1 acyl-CoA thioester hydrolase [Streptomyces phaeochromogenes]